MDITFASSNGLHPYSCIASRLQMHLIDWRIVFVNFNFAFQTNKIIFLLLSVQSSIYINLSNITDYI